MDKVQLVKQCQAGDKEAFAVLYKTYFPKLRTVVAYYVQNECAVRDILHDGFLIAFESINSLRNATKIDAWLITIMKNLSLQYLRNGLDVVTLEESDDYASELENDEINTDSDLTWEKLIEVINQLPEGYRNVFRLSVLDGMSHKEIGDRLGIAPHTSSSQLARAKAVLRRLITEYRSEIGILSIVAVALFVWKELFILNNKDEVMRPIITRNSEEKRLDVIVPNDKIERHAPHIEETSKMVHKAMNLENLGQVSEPNDCVPVVVKDSAMTDTTQIHRDIIDAGGLVAYVPSPNLATAETDDWSLSLAYAGNTGQDRADYYKTGISDTEGPEEVAEKRHHHMPLTISLSVNKKLSSRWGIESGIRYTLLRTDILSQSSYTNKEAIQRIHYIGVPLKFNYRVLTHRRVSVYGQGGIALDIPIAGDQLIRELPGSESDRCRIAAPIQWSIEGGVGFQYHFTPSFSIYAEPSLHYYFNTDSDIKTIRQEKPLELSIPIGLRYTW